MTKILTFAGKKQAGKTSAAHFVSAYITSQIARLNPNVPLSKRFTQTQDGKIIVDTTSGEQGILDFSRQDDEFASFAGEFIWPYVKIYSFADELKKVAMSVYGLTYEQCYGTNEQKNSFTKIKWEDMLKVFHPVKRNAIKKELANEYMTARELLQYFGTDVCRTLYDNCWIESTFRKIEKDSPDIAIIDDCRFENEAKESRKLEESKVIRLFRSVDNDDHSSEKILDADADLFNLNLHNEDMDIEYKNKEILDTLYKWKWFTEHIPLETR